MTERELVRSVHPEACAVRRCRYAWEILIHKPGDACYARIVLGHGKTAEEAWKQASAKIPWKGIVTDARLKLATEPGGPEIKITTGSEVQP